MMAKRFSIDVAGPKGVAVPWSVHSAHPSGGELEKIASAVSLANGDPNGSAGVQSVNDTTGRVTTYGGRSFYMTGTLRDRVEVVNPSSTYSDAKLQSELDKYDGPKRW